MIITIIVIILFIIATAVIILKLSELDEEVQNLYELLSDYQMRSEDEKA